MTASDPAHLRERGHAPTKASLKAWWSQFTLVTRGKKQTQTVQAGWPPKSQENHLVFGKPLRESLKYASVQISTASPTGELYVWGYIPVVVAKCGLYLKENATEIEGTFRVNGSNKRMRDLQAIFETPPRYGKSMDWKQEAWTTHDVASVFRRYLTQMPEPVIPVDMYHAFRQPLAREPVDQDEAIATYRRLIRQLPRANQYLLLYVLDLLSVFARKANKNRMDAANLAVIFRPGILSHPDHELNPTEHRLSQRVLEFLIAHQDWFMTDVNSPPRNDSVMLGAASSPRVPAPGTEETDPWERRIGAPGAMSDSPAGSNTILPLPSAHNPSPRQTPPRKPVQLRDEREQQEDWSYSPESGSPGVTVARRRTLNDRSKALPIPEDTTALTGSSAPAHASSPLAAVAEVPLGADELGALISSPNTSPSTGGANVHRSRTWASGRTGRSVRSAGGLSREGSLRARDVGKPLPSLPDEARERRVLRKRRVSKEYDPAPVER